MKITIYCSENRDGYISEEMYTETNVDKKAPSFSVYPLCECPEDAIIGRDLISCQEIAEAMKVAYEAGKAGEPFEIEIKDGDSEEDE